MLEQLETTALAIAGLKYVGAPAIQSAHSLLMYLIAPTFKAVGNVGGEAVQAWMSKRFDNGKFVLLDAAQKVIDSGVTPQPVREALLVEIIQHSSLVDEKDLRSKWSSLLANAAIPNNKVIPGFVEILRQLTPLHAQILDWMYGMKTSAIPDWIASWPDVERRDLEERFDLSPSDYALLITDLERLQLIEPRRELPKIPNLDHAETYDLIAARWNSRVKYDTVALSTLGIHFMNACRQPSAN